VAGARFLHDVRRGDAGLPDRFCAAGENRAAFPIRCAESGGRGYFFC